MVELDDGHGGGDGLSEVKIKCSNLEKKKEKKKMDSRQRYI